MPTSYFFGKPKPSHIEYYLNKYAILLKAPETSLQIYKNDYFTNCTQKTAIAAATNMKKTYFAVLQVGGIRNWKSKNFVSLII